MAAAVSQLICLTPADQLLGIRQISDSSEDELVTLVAPILGRYLQPPP